MHRLRWFGLLAAVLAVAAVGIVEPPRATAECSRLDYWPRMREAAPSARRVVIGTVSDVEVERRRPGDAREVTSFTLEVTKDVKGSGPRSIRLPGVVTNEGCITSRLWVRDGERIAVAFGGRAKSIAGPVSAVAFVGDEPGRARRRTFHEMPMMERVTERQLRQLARLPVGPLLFFIADDGRGPALWRSDGTKRGTHIVVRPRGTGPLEPRDLVTDGGLLYFSASDRRHGRELWVSDGSAAGTRMLRDIRPGPTGSEPDGLSVAWEDVVFAADDGKHGREPWYLSSWTGRAKLARDMNRVPDRSASSNPTEITPQDLGFIASLDDGVHGREPWQFFRRTVFDLFPGEEGSDPTEFTDGWDTWFVADAPDGSDVLHACEEECSQPVRIAADDELVSGVRELAVAADQVYFIAQGRSGEPVLGRAQSDWQYSNRDKIETKDAASFVMPAPPPSTEPPLEGPLSQLVTLRDQLYLVVDEAATGTELWRSDGTAAGTVPVLDLPDADLDPRDLVAVGKYIWFSADADDGTGREPWLSDGTADGTRLVNDLAPDGASDPGDFIGFRGRVAFIADDGEHGRELWLSDGRKKGTRLVLDIRPGPAGSVPTDLLVLGGRP